MSLRDWVNANLHEYLDAIVRMGAQSGIPGLISYRDTSALYEQYADEIWECLTDIADQLNQEGPIAYLCRFSSRMRIVATRAQFEQVMVHAAVEVYARDIVVERLKARAVKDPHDDRA